MRGVAEPLVLGIVLTACSGSFVGPTPEDDLDQVQTAVRTWHAYASRTPNLESALDTLAVSAETTRSDLGWQLQEVLAESADAHAFVDGLHDDGPYLPALPIPIGDRIIAVRPDRRAFVYEGYPYLVAIDGVPVTRWREAAERWVVNGSSALINWQTARLLRHVDRLRTALNLPRAGPVSFTLASAEGAHRTLSLDPLEQRPRYGDWPRQSSTILPGNLGYLRIEAMDAKRAAHVNAWLRTRAERLEGLIIDVRGNKGGQRKIMHLVDAWIGTEPRVINLARMRTGTPFSSARLEARGLYPVSDVRWSSDDQQRIRAALDGFQPSWAPETGFGPWHVSVLPGSTDPLDIPVVILQDERCFSATDVFLSAFAPLEHVTTMGTPSSGGSGRAETFELPWSGHTVSLSTMASYRPEGPLFDGVGVLPEVRVEARPEDHLRGDSDAAIQAAEDYLRRSIVAGPAAPEAPP